MTNCQHGPSLEVGTEILVSGSTIAVVTPGSGHHQVHKIVDFKAGSASSHHFVHCTVRDFVQDSSNLMFQIPLPMFLTAQGIDRACELPIIHGLCNHFKAAPILDDTFCKGSDTTGVLPNFSAEVDLIEKYVSTMFSISKVVACSFLFLLVDMLCTHLLAASLDFCYVRLLLATGIASFLMSLPKLIVLFDKHSLHAATAMVFVGIVIFPLMLLPFSNSAIRSVASIFPLLDAERFINAFPIDKICSTVFILGFSLTFPLLSAVYTVSIASHSSFIRPAILAYYLTCSAGLLLELQTISKPLIIVHLVAIFASEIHFPSIQEMIIVVFFPSFKTFSNLSFSRCFFHSPCGHSQVVSSPFQHCVIAFTSVLVGKRCDCHHQLTKMLRLSAHFTIVACVLFFICCSFWIFNLHSLNLFMYSLYFIAIAALIIIPCIVFFRGPYHYSWSILSIFSIVMSRFAPHLLNSFFIHSTTSSSTPILPQELLPTLLSACLPYSFLSFNPAAMRRVFWIGFNFLCSFASLYFFTSSVNMTDCLRIIFVNQIGLLTLFERICCQYAAYRCFDIPSLSRMLIYFLSEKSASFDIPITASDVSTRRFRTHIPDTAHQYCVHAHAENENHLKGHLLSNSNKSFCSPLTTV